jgi:hypothetical protein
MMLMLNPDELKGVFLEALGNGVSVTVLRFVEDRVDMQVTLVMGATLSSVAQKIIVTAIALYKHGDIDHGLSLDVTITNKSADFPNKVEIKIPAVKGDGGGEG